MHINCPHWQNPIEIVGDVPVEVVCPSCGSSINLDPGRTKTFLPGAVRQVGKFTLLEHLGAGAFGIVFNARDIELDRQSGSRFHIFQSTLKGVDSCCVLSFGLE